MHVLLLWYGNANKNRMLLLATKKTVTIGRISIHPYDFDP